MSNKSQLRDVRGNASVAYLVLSACVGVAGIAALPALGVSLEDSIAHDGSATSAAGAANQDGTVPPPPTFGVTSNAHGGLALPGALRAADAIRRARVFDEVAAATAAKHLFHELDFRPGRTTAAELLEAAHAGGVDDAHVLVSPRGLRLTQRGDGGPAFVSMASEFVLAGGTDVHLAPHQASVLGEMLGELPIDTEVWLSMRGYGDDLDAATANMGNTLAEAGLQFDFLQSYREAPGFFDFSVAAHRRPVLSRESLSEIRNAEPGDAFWYHPDKATPAELLSAVEEGGFRESHVLLGADGWMELQLEWEKRTGHTLFLQLGDVPVNDLDLERVTRTVEAMRGIPVETRVIASVKLSDIADEANELATVASALKLDVQATSAPYGELNPFRRIVGHPAIPSAGSTP